LQYWLLSRRDGLVLTGYFCGSTIRLVLGRVGNLGMMAALVSEQDEMSGVEKALRGAMAIAWAFGSQDR
jgi:hypothetical protein